jgi:hypothetical protein
MNEGTHFLIPWVQKAIIYDVRTKPRNISTTTGSKDLQMVSLTLRVLHRPEVKALPRIYQVCLIPQLHYGGGGRKEEKDEANNYEHSPSDKITTSESSHLLATKSSKPLLRNSTPQS